MLSPLQLLEFRRDRVSDKDEQFQEIQKHLPVTESNVITRIIHVPRRFAKSVPGKWKKVLSVSNCLFNGRGMIMILIT